MGTSRHIGRSNHVRDIVGLEIQRHWKVAGAFALAALALIAYANALPNAFHFDDMDGIVHNPALRNVENIPAFFVDIGTSGPGAKDWRPFLQITYALDYAVGGLNPAVFRITNLAFHIGAAWLIFLIVGEIQNIRREKKSPESSVSAHTAGFIAAAIFVVHTVNSEAVDYISSRSSVLVAFLYLLAFYCYLRGFFSNGEPAAARWRWAGLAAFALGLGTKATAITLPAALLASEMLLVIDRSENPIRAFRDKPKRLIKYFPIAAVGAAYVLLRFILLRGYFRRVLSSGELTGVTSTTYLLTQFRAWIYYLKLFLWPYPLITDFRGFGWSRSLWDGRVAFSLILIAAILAFAWRRRKREPMLTFFVLWFFISLLPEASFIPLFDAVTGYRAYLAYAGVSVVVVLLGSKFTTWIVKRAGVENVADARMRVGYGAVLAVVVLALTLATISRNRVWKNALTLWTDVVQKDPTNARAFANLALTHIEKQDYQKAGELLDQAVKLGPKTGSAYMLRGYLTYVLGQGDLGLADLNSSIQLSRGVPMPFYYRGEIYRKLGRYDSALADYRSALALFPAYTDAYMGTALIYMDKGQPQEAMEACRKMTAIDRDDPRGYNCLGILLLEQHRAADAIRIYQRGVIRVPRDEGLWYGLGLAYQEGGMHHEAADAFDRSSKLTR
jgi:protein O-mannosyl-transferase